MNCDFLYGLVPIAAAEGLGGGTDEVSRIAADVQALDIGSGGAQHGLTTRDHAGAVAEAGHDDATDLTGPQQSQQERRQQQQQQQQREHHAHGDPAAGQDDSGSEWTEDDGYEEEEEDEADEWQVAGKSQNSVRRQRRRVRRTGCRLRHSIHKHSNVPCPAPR